MRQWAQWVCGAHAKRGRNSQCEGASTNSCGEGQQREGMTKPSRSHAYSQPEKRKRQQNATESQAPEQSVAGEARWWRYLGAILCVCAFIAHVRSFSTCKSARIALQSIGEKRGHALGR